MELYQYGTQILMILGVAIAFYVALIKPQLDRISSDQAFLQALKIGDSIVTSGGMIGKIVRFEGSDVVVLALNDALQIRVVRSGVEGFFVPEITLAEHPTASSAPHPSRATPA